MYGTVELSQILCTVSDQTHNFGRACGQELQIAAALTLLVQVTTRFLWDKIYLQAIGAPKILAALQPLLPGLLHEVGLCPA